MLHLNSATRYDEAYFAKRGTFFPEIKGLIFAIFIKLFLKPKNLLDVGCAEGKLVKWATRLGIKAYGVDISSDASLKAEASIRHKCKVADLLNLPFKNNEFKAISCLAAMEHIDKENANQALNELLRVSKKHVLLQICVEDNPFERKHYLLDSTHVNVKKSSWWIKKFQELDLKIKLAIPKLGVFLLEKVHKGRWQFG